MFYNKKLWSVSVAVKAALAEAFAAPLGKEALTVTLLPRRDRARIEALFDAPPDAAALNTVLSVVAMLHGAKPPKLQIRELLKLDWLQKVAGDFPPLPVARWTIHGAQHRGKAPDRRHALQIDATSAFGTGEHPTTRGCLLMLEWLLKHKMPRRMLDIGCGSGILAMAYAKACRGKAVAVDLDPDSAIIARNNRDANGLRNNIRIGPSRGHTSMLVKANAPYDLIMANIFAGPLSHMAKDLKHHLRPGGIAILSGILAPQVNRVIGAHRMQRLCLVRQLKIGEWSVLVMQRRKSHNFRTL